MRLNINNIPVFVSTSWHWRAEKSSDFREKCRKLIACAAEKFIHPKKHLSVSHTSHLGGFAVANSPVGFDLEPYGRKVSPQAFRRFSTAQERELQLDPLQIWVMKEAAWKSLRGPHQPDTITQIQITKVTRIKKRNNHLFEFKSCKINGLKSFGQGIILCDSRTIMGIALTLSRPPSTLV